MGMIKNLAKKVLVATVVYAGKRVALKVANKVAEVAARKKAGKADSVVK